ncbi:MAG: hypothetical protein ACK5ZH_00010 [Alphaproteobacteria bacterium]|jgi:hypothetical protein
MMRGEWRAVPSKQQAVEGLWSNGNCTLTSRSTHLVTLLLLLLTLSACGFEPLHGRAFQEKIIGANLAGLQVDAPSGRLGETLKADIEDGINPNFRAGPTNYRLVITLDQQEIAQFVNPDGTASRGKIRVTSNYQLIRLADNKIIASGTLQRAGAFDSDEQVDYATYISREDARRRAVVDLANDYRLRLANLAPKMQ